MFLYLGEKRRIIASKDSISQEAAKKLEQKKIGAYYDGEFSFFMGENRAGFKKAFYLETDGTIRIEYEKVPPERIPPLSEQEQIAIDTALNVEYIACLMEANLQ